MTALLRARGLAVIDADYIARQVVEPGTPGLAAIKLAFGPAVVDIDGKLERQKLADQVFGKPDQLQRLEVILHPLIQTEVQMQKQAAAAAGHALAIYDVPLLFEKNLQSQFDATVVVWCTDEQQVERSMKRDGSNRSTVEKRLQSQMPMSQKKKLADILIDNSGSAEQLAAKVDQTLTVLAQFKK